MTPLVLGFQMKSSQRWLLLPPFPGGSGSALPAAPQEGSRKPPPPLLPAAGSGRALSSRRRHPSDHVGQTNQKPPPVLIYASKSLFSLKTRGGPVSSGRTAQFFTSLPEIWTGHKIPASQTRADGPFLR